MFNLSTGSRSTLNLLRQRTKSSDSKTSIESDRNSLDIPADDIAALSMDILRTRAAQKRRDSDTVMRGLESGTGKFTIPIVVVILPISSRLFCLVYFLVTIPTCDVIFILFFLIQLNTLTIIIVPGWGITHRAQKYPSSGARKLKPPLQG